MGEGCEVVAHCQGTSRGKSRIEDEADLSARDVVDGWIHEEVGADSGWESTTPSVDKARQGELLRSRAALSARRRRARSDSGPSSTRRCCYAYAPAVKFWLAMTTKPVITWPPPGK